MSRLLIFGFGVICGAFAVGLPATMKMHALRHAHVARLAEVIAQRDTAAEQLTAIRLRAAMPTIINGGTCCPTGDRGQQSGCRCEPCKCGPCECGPVHGTNGRR